MCVHVCEYVYAYVDVGVNACIYAYLYVRMNAYISNRTPLGDKTRNLLAKIIFICFIFYRSKFQLEN